MEGVKTKVCKNCGTNNRYVSYSKGYECKKCNSAKSRRWQKAHKAEHAEYEKRYRELNLDISKQRCSTWYEKNKDYKKSEARNQVGEMADWYVNMKLAKMGFAREDLLRFPEIREAYRINLKIKRACQNQKQLQPM